MSFSEDDLHNTMKFCLETLIDIINSYPPEENDKKTLATINLANIIFEIQDRQNSTDDMENFLQDDEDE